MPVAVTFQTNIIKVKCKVIQSELICRIERKLQLVVLFKLLMKIVCFVVVWDLFRSCVIHKRGHYFKSFLLDAVFSDGKHVLKTMYLLEGIKYKIFGS